jgi:hypothetical protein
MSSTGERTPAEVHDQDVLAHLIGDCDTIVGFPVNLQVCYSYDSSTQTVTVNLTLAGQTMGTASLSASNPSASFSLALAVVKASIQLNLDTSMCLSFNAQACYKKPFSDWNCSTYNGQIACF